MINATFSSSGPSLSPSLGSRATAPLAPQDSPPAPLGVDSLPQAMVYSDIDDTLLGPNDAGLAETRQVLTEHEGETANGICTGRGLGQAKILAERLGSFPLQFIGVNNGLFVYHNERGVPAREFLADLEPSQADAAWTAEIARRTNGWQMGTVLATMLEAVGGRGFQPAPPSGRAYNLEGDVGGEHLRVSYYLDQPSFNISNTEAGLTPLARTTGDAIAAEIEASMAARKIQSTHYVIDDHGHVAIYGFQPPGIDKKALLEHELSRYPSVRAVITAGDNVNDTMLDPPTYGEVPNYRILAGTHHPHGDELARQERVLRCASGELGPPLEAHLETIRASVPQPAVGVPS